MGAGAICHNKAAVQIKEDMKRMMRPCPAGRKMFCVTLQELRDQGKVKDGVPIGVRSMVEYLQKQGLHHEGLFRVNGSARVVEILRQRFDAGEAVDLDQEADVFAVASLLKQFLRDLPEGLIHPTIHKRLLQLYQDSNEADFCSDIRQLLHLLPELHYNFLRYLCHFLCQVEEEHAHNRMTASNLATVFGPNVFHVSSGFEGIQEQNICNNIMKSLIQNYNSIFQSEKDGKQAQEEQQNIIMVKEANANTEKSSNTPFPKTHVPRVKKLKVTQCTPVENPEFYTETLSPDEPIPTTRKKKKIKQEATEGFFPQPNPSGDLISRNLTQQPISPRAESMNVSPGRSPDNFSSLQEDGQPISPFYISSQISPGCSGPDLTDFLERTIRKAVEQHIFSTLAHTVKSSQGLDPAVLSPVSTARERRRNQRELQVNFRFKGDEENMLSRESERSLTHESLRNRKPQNSPTLTVPSHNQDCFTPMEFQGPPDTYNGNGIKNVGPFASRANHSRENVFLINQTPAMKIQEALSGSEPCNDVPRLDLSTLTDNNNWPEPVPAYSSWQRESIDRDDTHMSPHAGGKFIRQLIEEDSDPMVSPRFYGYGDLDDTEVPPSPPNAHSFVSRRRSSSLGSCEEEREELTSAQLSKRIHVLKKKIRRFEEKFEEDHKYRPSHGDKATNSEVLRWMNELAKLRKDFKDHKLLKSEEDLTPIPRQRSNTLPKSFGSQLEKKTPETKAPKPPVESTLEAVTNKLQEKRKEAGRPEDIKDMTREQICGEKVALQKALLFYESIHGRPITKNERQVMKPLYDRYRLVKQILCRACTIPVIGSPSSKRRGPLLQPIIEGVPALFFSDAKEEEECSDDDDSRTQFMVTVKPELSVLGFLDQLEEDTDGFISPVDDLSPSKSTTDMRLSNLHSASMQELVEELQEAREEKKRIRKNLREFEDQFFKQNGRNVQKEDRSPLAGEYNEYKHIKAKLRLLEVLISKRDSSKFI